MRVAGSVEIDRPADQVWSYVADYGHDPIWRAGVRQMPPVAKHLLETPPITRGLSPVETAN